MIEAATVLVVDDSPENRYAAAPLPGPRGVRDLGGRDRRPGPGDGRRGSGPDPARRPPARHRRLRGLPATQGGSGHRAHPGAAALAVARRRRRARARPGERRRRLPGRAGRSDRARRDRPRAAARAPRRDAAAPRDRPRRDGQPGLRRAGQRCSPAMPSPPRWPSTPARSWALAARRCTGSTSGADPRVADDSLPARVASSRVPSFDGAGAVVPLVAYGRRLGALAVETDAPLDRDLLLALAAQGAQALERAGLYEHQRYIATTLQAGLLPRRLPEIPGAEVAARYNAGAQAMDVGGDFYDVFARGEDWLMVIGDVCGRGAEAATLTSLARHTIRAQAQHLAAPERDPVGAARGDRRRVRRRGPLPHRGLHRDPRHLGHRRPRRPPARPDPARRRPRRRAPHDRLAARAAGDDRGHRRRRTPSAPATRSSSTPTA